MLSEKCVSREWEVPLAALEHALEIIANIAAADTSETSGGGESESEQAALLKLARWKAMLQQKVPNLVRLYFSR